MDQISFQNVSILIPAMDETYLLEQTVDTIMKTCNMQDIFEIIFILGERSTPDCYNTAKKLVERYQSQVKIWILMQKRPFAGGAVQDGIDAAGGSHLIMMSADMETDPELVCQFIQEAKQVPSSIITASRWIRGGGFQKYNKVKLVCNFFFEKTIALFYSVKLTDLTFGYRIFPAELMKNIRWEELKHPFFLETALKPIRLGVPFREIPCKWKARTEGESQNSFFANFKYFRTAWNIRFEKREDFFEEKKGDRT